MSMANPTRSSAAEIRPEVRLLLDYLAQAGRPELSELPLAEARAAYQRMQVLVEAPPRELPVVRNLACPGPAGEIPLRLYDPRERRGPGPVVAFYHGGGFVVGDLDSHHALCTEIAAELDLPVVSVDYRLAPEHPFPAAPDDCEAATRWIAENGGELGLEITGLIAMGDSAGGNLAITTTQVLSAQPAAVPVRVQVAIYPAPGDVTQSDSFREFSEGYLLTTSAMDWFTRCYGADPTHPRAYPSLGEHAGMPPTVLATAGLDPLRDSGRAYAAQLVLAGSEVVYLEMRGIIHGFGNLRRAIPSAQDDLAAILSAVKLMLRRG
jgi:acetyl esterase